MQQMIVLLPAGMLSFVINKCDLFHDKLVCFILLLKYVDFLATNGYVLLHGQGVCLIHDPWVYFKTRKPFENIFSENP